MTDEEIARLRALCVAATPGPWRRPMRAAERSWIVAKDADGDEINIANCKNFHNETDNAEFIAVARTAIPALLDEAERLRAAWRTVQESDVHPEACGLRRSFLSGIGGLTGDGPYIIESPCTCGLHERKADARKVLNGEAMSEDRSSENAGDAQVKALRMAAAVEKSRADAAERRALEAEGRQAWTDHRMGDRESEARYQAAMTAICAVVDASSAGRKVLAVVETAREFQKSRRVFQAALLASHLSVERTFDGMDVTGAAVDDQNEKLATLEKALDALGRCRCG